MRTLLMSWPIVTFGVLGGNLIWNHAPLRLKKSMTARNVTIVRGYFMGDRYVL